MIDIQTFFIVIHGEFLLFSFMSRSRNSEKPLPTFYKEAAITPQGNEKGQTISSSRNVLKLAEIIGSLGTRKQSIFIPLYLLTAMHIVLHATVKIGTYQPEMS